MVPRSIWVLYYHWPLVWCDWGTRCHGIYRLGDSKGWVWYMHRVHRRIVNFLTCWICHGKHKNVGTIYIDPQYWHLSRDWVFQPGKRLFPCHGFSCLSESVILAIYWKRLTKWTHFEKNIYFFTSHKSFLQNPLSHKHEKYKLINHDQIKPQMIKLFNLIFYNLASS